jgi:hypothetical protein
MDIMPALNGTVCCLLTAIRIQILCKVSKIIDTKSYECLVFPSLETEGQNGDFVSIIAEVETAEVE